MTTPNRTQEELVMKKVINELIKELETEKDSTIQSLESKIDKIAKGLEFFSSRLSDLEKEKKSS